MPGLTLQSMEYMTESTLQVCSLSSFKSDDEPLCYRNPYRNMYIHVFGSNGAGDTVNWTISQSYSDMRNRFAIHDSVLTWSSTHLPTNNINIEP